MTRAADDWKQTTKGWIEWLSRALILLALGWIVSIASEVRDEAREGTKAVIEIRAQNTARENRLQRTESDLQRLNSSIQESTKANIELATRMEDVIRRLDRIETQIEKTRP